MSRIENLDLYISANMKTIKYLCLFAFIAATACNKSDDEYVYPSFTFKANTDAAPATVVFTNLSVNAKSYLWIFGDGTTSDSVSPTHVYAEAGDYKIRLVAYGKNNKDTSCYVFSVYDSSITAAYKVENTSSASLDNLRTFYINWDTYGIFDLVEHGILGINHTTAICSTYHPSIEVLWQSGSNYYLLAYPNEIVSGDTTTLTVYSGAGVYVYTYDPLQSSTKSTQSIKESLENGELLRKGRFEYLP
jgi:PKD repeat protein